MKLLYRDGLLFTSVKLRYQGKTVVIDNVVVDTGASACIFEPLAIESLGIVFTKEDEIETFFGVNGMYNYVKRAVDSIIVDDMSLDNFNFYIGSVENNINGLIGLDLLVNMNAIIDLKQMEIHFE